MKQVELPRVRRKNTETNPLEGIVKWDAPKSMWYIMHFIIVVVGAPVTFNITNFVLTQVLAATTVCIGSVAIHRLLVHRSFQCPQWLEYLLVHIGTVVGMGGPFKNIRMHDIRDWAQRHESCHNIFTHNNPIWKDYWWQVHCKIVLKNAPNFEIESEVKNDPVYIWMERTWMLQQLPLALLLFCLGGWGAVVWGISVRVLISTTGHWFVGFLAHNGNERSWEVKGHVTQGRNIPHSGLITMGEGWHNNHHAFPESAKLGLTKEQPDPGWWTISLLKRIGLVWEVKLPEDLPERKGLVKKIC